MPNFSICTTKRFSLYVIVILLQLFLIHFSYGQNNSASQEALNAEGNKQNSKTKMIFSFFPESSQAKMENRYVGLIKLLSEKFEREYIFETREDYPGYMRAIEAEEFDLAVVNAFDYVKIKNRTKYIPVVSRSDSLIATFVTTSKTINNISDLKNKVIGFSSEYASAAIAARYMFLKDDVFPSDYTPKYFNGHIPCLNAVAENKIDACVTGERIYNKFLSRGKEKLRVIAKGEDLPQLVILVHPKLKREISEITQFFLSLEKNSQGRSILNETYLVTLEKFSDEKYYLCELLLDYISSHEDIN